MSDIDFDCPKCSQHLVVDESGAGLEVPCPKCSAAIRIPHTNPQKVLSLISSATEPSQAKVAMFKFSCPHCRRKYEDRHELADKLINCLTCNASFQVPRPSRGYYASVTEPQLELAELYGIQVAPDMFRGQLKELIAKARENSRKNPPSKEQWNRYWRRNNERTSIMAVGRLQNEDELSENERMFQKAEADIRWNTEHEFGPDGYFSDLYKRPSRAQFDAIWTWIAQHGLSSNSESSIAQAIGALFPELKKRQ